MATVCWCCSIFLCTDYFWIPHNTLCFPPKFCISHCLQIPFGKCSTPRSIWKQWFIENLGGHSECIMGSSNSHLIWLACKPYCRLLKQSTWQETNERDFQFLLILNKTALRSGKVGKSCLLGDKIRKEEAIRPWAVILLFLEPSSASKKLSILSPYCDSKEK